MQLSVEVYESLMHSLRSYPAVGSERRRHPRTQADCRAEVTIIPLAGNAAPKPISVAVEDVSRLGIGIIHGESIELGRQFLLCLSHCSDVAATTRMIICIVRRIEQTPDRQFRMGCEFTGTMHPDLPTDEIAPGLEKHQSSLFEKDAQEATAPYIPPKPLRLPQRIASLFRRKSA